MPNDDFILHNDISQVAPTIYQLIEREAERQARKLIMIPSESYAPLAVRQALGSVFQNVYAEGYPPLRMTRDDEALLLDQSHQLVYYRRYADRRFYKGVDYVHFVETLAQRRAAKLFATDMVSPSDIYVNVQALSGSAANLAIYDTLLNAGDTIMGMDLFQGGHLTHGSEFNQSGKRYKVVSYGVDSKTQKLDYDRMMELAIEHRPRLIIGGYTSYPWSPDWIKYREIADAVGAYLMADISHTAGMVVAGVHPNPVGFADIISFTTHKTMCGPRGAVVMTADEEIGLMLDLAVFPGAQGGPHVNKFAAMCVAFELAETEMFKNLQKQIVKNARALASGLERRGLKLAYGGTDTHLLLLDVGAIPTSTGFPLRGEMAVRILDIAGIVANKNTIPGDDLTALASGVRLGTPWVTQRGLDENDMDTLAGLIHDIVVNIQPFAYNGLSGILPRGKIDLDIFNEVKRGVAELANKASHEYEGKISGYPHYDIPAEEEVLSPNAPPVVLKISGWRAEHFIEEICTSNLRGLAPNATALTFLLDRHGSLIDQVAITRLPNDNQSRLCYLMAVHPERINTVKAWLRGLADGYVLFDDDDIYRKIQGPVVIEVAHNPEAAKLFAARDLLRYTQNPPIASYLYDKFPKFFDLSKPYFIGASALESKTTNNNKDTWTWSQPDLPLRKTPLYELHQEMNGRMVPFAGWEMPVRYSTGVLEEHLAVRQAAGLFDVAHMGVFDVSGPHATSFLDLVCSNYIAWLDPGQSCYAYLLDPDGNVIDDIMVYCRQRDNYLMVVNAANAEKDWDWLNAVNEQRVIIDKDRPYIQATAQARIRDLKDPIHGPDCKVDIAFQGPAALTTLQDLTDDVRKKMALKRLRRTDLMEIELAGIELIIARTGYTGEDIGYEIFVHPDQAAEFCRIILEKGEPYGVLPVGLGARDSLRTEFGLPLYGHELAGPYNIDPIEAGFPGYVKYHKPYFIGREAMLSKENKRSMQVLRFRMNEKGVRVPKTGDPVVNRRGQIVGYVTSCSIDSDGYLIGLAYCSSNINQEGTPIQILTLPGRVPKGKDADKLEPGDKLVLPDDATVLSRFVVREEQTGALPSGSD
ncbi:MAG: glycine cleavage system aminomethyltransferase GcvT [Anaerolineales bacterium]|nr:glycine cleavage system aminomethyltransferase GcvT [Anaerolineales bacterium]